MLPRWLVKSMGTVEQTQSVRRMLSELELNTVCQSAHCPNLGECFSAGTATFMILGNICTRTCTFCAVEKGIPQSVDEDEPERIAQAISQLKINHAVITSVTRDDLSDGGVNQFITTISAIRALNPEVTVEILIPDFNGSELPIEQILTKPPDIFNHNLETVSRLYPQVRPQASYPQSLKILKFAKELAPNLITKSGIMVGLGETINEIKSLMDDLIKIKCAILTIGQYLRPSLKHRPVEKYYTPDEFEELRLLGLEKGFRMVISSPFTRSSYHAQLVMKEVSKVAS